MNTKQFKGIFSYNLSILKESKYKETAIGTMLLLFVFFSFLYGMFRIPVFDIGIVRMSPITFLDMTYIILASALMGALVALFRYKMSIASVSSKGTGIGSFALGFLVPYINAIRVFSLSLLGFALYSIANTIYTKTCPSCKVDIKPKEMKLPTQQPDEIFSLLQNKFILSALVMLVVIVIANQFIATSAFASLVSSSSGGTVVISSDSLKLEYGPKTTLKPMPLAVEEQPAISGYKTKVKPLPTISELQMSPSTGDLAQDLLNNVIPRGTPWYGQEAGVSFDDPITAQNLWAKGRAIQLDSAQDERWKRIANSFTCDYCCGSPQNPTIITRCGCAHSAAAQGMAKWFIKNYGDKYSDEEIYGEMARWYAVWYPGPTIKRIVQETSL